MTKQKTHYDNLQVMENASLEVIKGAYKYLSQKYHPDKAPNGKSREYDRIMKIIAKAYQVLSDHDRKAEYDDYLARQRASYDQDETNNNSSSSQQDTSKSVSKYDFSYIPDEDMLYEIVAEELENNAISKGLMLKAHAKALYLFRPHSNR